MYLGIFNTIKIRAIKITLLSVVLALVYNFFTKFCLSCKHKYTYICTGSVSLFLFTPYRIFYIKTVFFNESS